MKEKKLNLNDLSVQSFVTEENFALNGYQRHQRRIYR